MQETITHDGERRAPPDPNDNPLFSTDELTRYLVCSTTFARKLMDAGEIPSGAHHPAHGGRRGRDDGGGCEDAALGRRPLAAGGATGPA